jgi:hypothetical protein
MLWRLLFLSLASRGLMRVLLDLVENNKISFGPEGFRGSNAIDSSPRTREGSH